MSERYSAEQREIWNVFVAAYHAGANSLREGATADQIFAAWSAELLRHRATVGNTLARQAINDWSKREKIPFWQIHMINLVERNAAGPLRAGTTIPFEPIASIGGQGFYLEDMFVITKTGAELAHTGCSVLCRRDRNRDAGRRGKASIPALNPIAAVGFLRRP